MRILGIDSDSTQITGVLLVDGKYIECWVASSKLKTASERFDQLSKSISSIIKLAKTRVDKVWIEAPLFIQSPHATITTASIVAVIQFCCLQEKIPYQQIRVTSWKKITLGNGKAKKEQVREFIGKEVKEASQHFCDAYCIALAGTKLMEADLHGKMES